MKGEESFRRRPARPCVIFWNRWWRRAAENGRSCEGYRIGGKTATSEKLPRSLKKYISSFMGFAPADDPQVIALITIDEPAGIYYGGTIAAPVIADIF
ncbi:MAG: penicillin-binding transpeptidase domain-containing protein [Clostridium fessum]